MRFVQKLEMSEDALTFLQPIDDNCAKHISVINDIHSWEKELHQSKSSCEQGSILCSRVRIVADECGLDIEASKRVLENLCREWERIHLEHLRSSYEMGEDVARYCGGLGYQMSGNEMWSRHTRRYHAIDG